MGTLARSPNSCPSVQSPQDVLRILSDKGPSLFGLLVISEETFLDVEDNIC